MTTPGERGATPPAYLETHRRGELARRVEAAEALLSPCTLCPRECRVDRLAGETGTCAAGPRAEVASAGPHYGEESPLVGSGGSGTIFLAGCNLRCVFCQNFDISQGERGRRLSARALGRMMIDLQQRGCENVNFVTPSHQLPAILAGLVYAIDDGLRLPLVYNTSGYDSVETLRLLDGVFDIYMPDLKTLDATCAERYLCAPDYPAVVEAALREMSRQVGELAVDERGTARRGILLRHLVMPNDLAASREALTFIRDAISPNTYVNIMAQWHPAGELHSHPELDQPLPPGAYERALAIAAEVGIERLDERRPKLRLIWR